MNNENNKWPCSTKAIKSNCETQWFNDKARAKQCTANQTAEISKCSGLGYYKTAKNFEKSIVTPIKDPNVLCYSNNNIFWY